LIYQFYSFFFFLAKRMPSRATQTATQDATSGHASHNAGHHTNAGRDAKSNGTSVPIVMALSLGST
jgi:hypothetical protein